MLSRFRPSSPHLRLLTLISSPNHFSTPNPQFTNPIPNSNFLLSTPRSLSTNRNNNSNNGNDHPTPKIDLWNISTDNEEEEESVFGEDAGGTLEGIFGGDGKPAAAAEKESWLGSPAAADGGDPEDDIFKGVEKEVEGGKSEEWATEDGAWSLKGEEDKVDDVFGVGDDVVFGFRGDELGGTVEIGKSEEERKLEEKVEEERRLKDEEKVLSNFGQIYITLYKYCKLQFFIFRNTASSSSSSSSNCPNRAFGDLVAASGITEEMLDSLMALKDMDGVKGLPPLTEIEDMRYEKTTRKSTRAEIERQKQEEVAKARVRQVDEKGKAYGTGRRKCSIARVWIQPGDGRFVVNEKEFDVYFPMLDHRAALLRPFSETKTLGLWNIDCTVKGGGVSGQVGAIQLGISRALQNWEPDLRPPLRSAGFLTRDPRVVERKKPGQAKARKSFQWVKR
ncbi:hypothetical protein RHGRI_026640 [Rhododendron griersonianum]|uniref:Ribosomal protein S5 domain 2-like superfamily protein n=1 Tax=Rhododendron griersonianum TaxID=479676 RepID=A0AAV6IX31_9ERIC|nr:hypothetical protein RHGRI_026640 [Rhododendron griersonianum]